MSVSKKTGAERKLFGGANFLVVLWVLFSIFQLSIVINQNPISLITSPDYIVFLIPLVFLAVLNVFMGITLFFPQEKNKMWILSMLIVAVTMVALNTFQLKIEQTKENLSEQEELADF